MLHLTPGMNELRVITFPFKRTMRSTYLFLFFVSCNVFRAMQPEHVSLCLRDPMRVEGETSKDEGGF
jgi:hypothetical protein